MVANITTGKDVYGALAYNQEKVDRGDGKVLLTHIVREPADGRFRYHNNLSAMLYSALSQHVD